MVHVVAYRALLRWARQDQLREQMPMVYQLLDSSLRKKRRPQRPQGRDLNKITGAKDVLEVFEIVAQRLAEEGQRNREESKGEGVGDSKFGKGKEWDDATQMYRCMERMHSFMEPYITIRQRPGSSREFTENLASMIRSSFREPLRAEETIMDRNNECLEALRFSDEVQRLLDGNEAKRASRADSDGILFRVGDSVYHRKFRYRAVITGWDKRPTVDVSTWDGVKGLASGAEQPFYNVIAHDEDIPENMPSIRYAAQENLELLEDIDDKLICSDTVPDHFDFFSPEVGRFVPKPALAHEYGLDEDELAVAHAARQEELRPALSRILKFCFGLKHAVRDWKLKGLYPRDSPFELESADIVRFFTFHIDFIGKSQLSLSDRGCEPRGTAFQSKEASALRFEDVEDSELELCTHSAIEMINRHRFVLHSLNDARGDHNDREDIHFKMGQVVRDLKYDYRGIVFSWNFRPRIDVSDSEGIVGLPSGKDQPFFCCIPDAGDCQRVFGQQIDVRYVAQENLELVTDEEDIRRVSHPYLEADDNPFLCYSEREKIYVPRADLRYQFPLDFDEHLRIGNEVPYALDKMLHSYMQKQDLAELEKAILVCLRRSPDALRSKQLRKFYDIVKSFQEDFALWKRTETAVSMSKKRNFLNAENLFESVIAEDSTNTEVRARRAQNFLSLNWTKHAQKDFGIALKADPNHIRALPGNAKTLSKLGDHAGAIKFFRRALRVDPWCEGAVKEKMRALRALNENDIEP
eukprot:g5206.t1